MSVALYVRSKQSRLDARVQATGRGAVPLEPPIYAAAKQTEKDQCGVFRRQWAKFRPSLARRSRIAVPETGFSGQVVVSSVGVVLALLGARLSVFRAAALSIVFTLAVGQNAALCQAWCDAPQAAATGCHHTDGATSASMTRKDDCNHARLGVIAFVSEDVRRDTSTPNVLHMFSVPRFRLAPLTTDIRSGRERGQQTLLEAQPLVTPLRI